jgi:hypothetical protein
MRDTVQHEHLIMTVGEIVATAIDLIEDGMEEACIEDVDAVAGALKINLVVPDAVLDRSPILWGDGQSPVSNQRKSHVPVCPNSTASFLESKFAEGL